MKINHRVVVFDAAGLRSESEFWAGVLEGAVDVDDDSPLSCVEKLAGRTCRPVPQADR